MTVHKSNGAAQGGASKSDTKKVEPTPGATQPPQAPIVEAKTEPVKAITVEERKNKNELFNKLLDKHGIYSESQKKMEQFAIGSDENSQSLVLKDAKGNQFSTGNPIVLKEVIELVRAQIKMQCGQVEEEILNFVV